MPKESGARHTAESLAAVVDRLNTLSAQVLASKTLMEIHPPLASIEVLRESSMVEGFARLTSWADALRDAVHDARMAATRGVSAPVSDSPQNGVKPVKRSSRK